MEKNFRSVLALRMGLSVCLLVGFSVHAASQLPKQELEELRTPPKAATLARPLPQSAVDQRGTAASDYLSGSNQDDRLAGGVGADVLYGAGGNDELLGEEGDDYLDGQEGNDQLKGGPGNDRYRFIGQGLGADTLTDSAGQNTLIFMDARNPMVVDKRGDEYVIAYGGSSSIRLGSSTFDTMKFLSLSTLVDKEEFLQLYGRGAIGYPRKGKSPQGKATLTAGPLGQEVSGSAADEILIGGAGEDVLMGGGGSDEFRPGGPSGAAALGGTGNDVYVFGRNDGRLLIRDEGGNDEIRMGAGIRTSDVTVRKGPAEGWSILVAGTSQAANDVKGNLRWSIQLLRLDGGQAGSVERISFADGTVWDDIDKRALAAK